MHLNNKLIFSDPLALLRRSGTASGYMIEQQPIFLLIDLEKGEVDASPLGHNEISWKLDKDIRRGAVLPIMLHDDIDASRLPGFVDLHLHEIARRLAHFIVTCNSEGMRLYSLHNGHLKSNNTASELERLLEGAPRRAGGGYIEVRDYLDGELDYGVSVETTDKDVRILAEALRAQARREGYIFWDDPLEYFCNLRCDFLDED